MATKRFTDAEKWKDPFFENLSNNFKLIWLYLLDDCDNAGLWGKSIKRLNFHCNTNVTEQELLKVLGKRIIPITESLWLIPKFLEFQYGSNWMTSKNKAVESAREKLSIKGIDVDSIPSRYSITTSDIPYQYPIDTGKAKAKVKAKVKVKDKVQDKSKDLSKELDKDSSNVDALQSIINQKLNIYE
jgi:hypothetical protein